jgi:transcriptional regulator with XRE-family HTH domain
MNPVLLIKHYRIYRGLSQHELAAKVGISQGYLSELEKNMKSPTVRMLYAIANALEICPKELLECHCKECEGANE